MARCPLCRAALTGEPLCPRCGADLSSVQAAEAEASRHLRAALARLADGEHSEAQAAARQALRYRRTPLARIVAQWLEISDGHGTV